MLLCEHERSLTQGIFRDTIHGSWVTRGVLINSTFPISDFMHSSHNGDLRKTSIQHVLDEPVMGGQITHMIIGVVFKTVAPSHVQANIRFSKRGINIAVRLE